MENNTNLNPNYDGSYHSEEMREVDGKLVDRYGQKIKRRFGLRLIISVLLMPCGIFTALTTLAAGIIGCIYSCKADKAYRERRLWEFRDKKKVANIVLGIGIGIAIVVLAWNTAIAPTYREGNVFDGYARILEKGLEKIYGYDINMDTFWSDLKNGDATPGGKKHKLDFSKAAQITVNGKTISLPCKYEDLVAAGFHIYNEDFDKNFDPAEDFYFCGLHTEAIPYLGAVAFAPTEKNETKIRDGEVFYLCFYDESEECREAVASYGLVGGLRFGLTRDEVMKLLGEPDYSTSQGSEWGLEKYYEWHYQDDLDRLIYVCVWFYDDEMYGIGIGNESRK
ncbi:MAG: hypothetical protein J6R94_01865 [Agathobacter sp.]|nr:hypothetical protein [Agathobacter sp.]